MGYRHPNPGKFNLMSINFIMQLFVVVLLTLFSGMRPIILYNDLVTLKFHHHLARVGF